MHRDLGFAQLYAQDAAISILSGNLHPGATGAAYPATWSTAAATDQARRPRAETGSAGSGPGLSGAQAASRDP